MFNRNRVRKPKTERKPFLRLRKRSKGESPSLVRVSPESSPDDDDDDVSSSPMSPKGCDKDDVQLLNFGLAFGAGVVLGMIIKK